MSRDETALPFALLAIGVVSVSVSALIARRALVEATPLMLASWRMGFASIFFFGLAAARSVQARRAGAETSPVTRNQASRLVGGGVCLAVHFLTWFASLTMTSVSVATLLCCTTPLWAAIGQLFLGRGSTGWRFWAAFAAAIVGMALVVHPSGGEVGVTHGQLIGDLLALIGGAVIAVYFLAIEGLQDLGSARIVTWTYSSAAAVLWIIALAIGHPTLRYSAPVWEAIALLTLVPQIIGHTLLNHSLKFFGAHIVSFSILAEPVIASALAVVLLHEIVTAVMILGGVIVLGALGYVLAQSKREVIAVEEVEEL